MYELIIIKPIKNPIHIPNNTLRDSVFYYRSVPNKFNPFIFIIKKVKET